MASICRPFTATLAAILVPFGDNFGPEMKGRRANCSAGLGGGARADAGAAATSSRISHGIRRIGNPCWGRSGSPFIA